MVGEPATAKLTTSDPDGQDGKVTHNIIAETFLQGWYVEWMRITMSTGEVFSCPFGGWLDNGSDAGGPGSRTVSCAASSGDYCQLHLLVEDQVLSHSSGS